MGPIDSELNRAYNRLNAQMMHVETLRFRIAMNVWMENWQSALGHLRELRDLMIAMGELSSKIETLSKGADTVAYIINIIEDNEHGC